MAEKLSISEVNGLQYEEFISKFGNVVEHCGLCAAAVWRNKPFKNLESLHSAICEFLDQLPISGKEGILRLHPDLAGKLAAAGQLTSESTKEQAAAGLHLMTDEERQRMSKLNENYKQTFGFPFVICARQNKKDAVLEGLEKRLRNTAEGEAVTGVNEVKKICRLRLLDIVDENSVAKL